MNRAIDHKSAPRLLAHTLAVLCVATTLLGACSQQPPEPLDDLGALPAFSLIDQQGQAVTRDSLQGTVWAANFLFTSCPTACPPLAQATARLQARLQAWRQPTDRVRIVSVSVDPMTDTPEVLRTWAVKYGADATVWTQLTGDYDAMEKLVVEGFMQPIVRSDRAAGLPNAASATAAPTPLDTAHSLRFVLVDQQGHLRGLFDKDDAGLQRLDAAMRWLAAHPGR